MPYVLTVLFVVLLFSLIGLLGTFGIMVKNLFNGLFSNFASYFIPFFLLYHGIMWYYDTKRKICLRRIICSFMALFGMSTLQHIITSTVDEELAQIKNIAELYVRGKNGQGGGVFGGLFTRALMSIGGNVSAIIIVFIILTLMLLQMFNITPLYMLKAIFGKNKKTQKKPSDPAAGTYRKRKIKHKNIDIFDDEEDANEDTISRFEMSGTATIVKVSDEIADTENHNIKNEITEKCDSCDLNEKNEASNINSNVNGYSSQLEAYDENKDYSCYSSENKNESTDELVVVKNMIGDANDNMETVSVITDAESSDIDQLINEDDDKAIQEAQEEEISSQGDNSESDVDSNSLRYEIIENDEDGPEIEIIEDLGETVEIEIIEDLGTTTEVEIIEDVGDTNEIDIIEDLGNTTDMEILEDFGDTAEIDIEEDFNDEIIEGNEEARYEYDEPAENKKNNEGMVNSMANKAYETASNNKTIPESSEQSYLIIEKEQTPKSDLTRKEPPKTKAPYKFPPLDFLKSKSQDENTDEINEELQENARKIVTTLSDFGVRTKIVDIARGPTVTRYEIAPEAGVRVKSIANLADDIALNLAAEGIRIESPIPGKSAVGIEVPNKTTSFVYLKDLLAKDKFKNAKGVLTCAVGKSISGDDIYMDVEKTPHLLVAGATGMGKSVCINSLLISMLYKASPEDLRLILIDPKRVELSNYNGIPHLLVPVVCEPKKSLGALQWAVTEMENRFETIETAGVRNLTEFNEKVDNGYEAEKMSRIVIIIDELADLKMAVPDIEGHITRLTQKARAAGIHIIIGTQRPSVDVITGLIKNNIPSRIAFRVPSQVDSRTILDEQGAEKLVSRGDMLVKLVDALKPARVQGAYVSASEIEDVINFLKSNGEANYDESVIQQIDSNAAKIAKAEKKDSDEEGGCDDELDSEFYNALRLAAEEGKISSSLLQRKLKLGFQRAARIIDQMYDLGYIGDPNGSKPRDVLITIDDYREIMMRREDDEE